MSQALLFGRRWTKRQVCKPASIGFSSSTKQLAGVIDMDWAKLQVMTTIDYAHDSWITTFMSGALNYQVVHHLFPHISQVCNSRVLMSLLISTQLFFWFILDSLPPNRANRSEDLRRIQSAICGLTFFLGRPQGPLALSPRDGNSFASWVLKFQPTALFSLAIQGNKKLFIAARHEARMANYLSFTHPLGHHSL